MLGNAGSRWRVGRLGSALLVGTALLGLSGRAEAVVLNWDALTWPPGDLTRTYTGIGNGNLVFAVTGDTAYLTTAEGTQTPDISGVTHGGSNQDSLLFRTDYPVGVSDQLTITVDFTHTYGISDLSFTLFDIDEVANDWIDELQITATDGASTFDPTSFALGSCVSQTTPNTLVGTCNVGNSSANGNATITFGQSGITRLTIVYRNTIPQANPGFQRVAIHDLTFAETMGLVKRAFESDGTPIPDGATLPVGVPIKFMIYVNNMTGAVLTDVSLQDVLDPGFTYSTGSMRYSASVANCAATICTALEEAAIYAAVNGGIVGSDAVNADPVNRSGATLNAGNQNAANGQLNVTAGRVWAWLFTVTLN